jgi:thiosulfate/3-mercaptopyruvate sulfurtransferase
MRRPDPLCAGLARLRLPGRLLVLALAPLFRIGAADLEAVRPAHGEPAAPTQYAKAELLMDTERLGVLLGDGKTPPGASLVLVDARAREEFQNGHLPGARYLESDSFQDPARKPYYLPAPEVVARFVEAAGIRADTRVVVYDAHGGRLAARIWFTLWAYGHDRVSILEGGYPKWRDESRSVNTDPAPKPSQPGDWQPAAQLRGVCSFDELPQYRAAARPGAFPATMLLDARSYQEYCGTDARGKAGGHIPGAANLPWDSLLKPVAAKNPTAQLRGFLVFREPAEIHAMLRAAGITARQPLAVYDQSGGRAAHVAFALQLMGYEQTVVYVGGWREYGSREDVEIEH